MSTNTNKNYPVLILSTGSFAHPTFYDPTTTLLPSHIDLRIPHLLTAGPSPDASRPGPTPTMYDDAAMLASHIKAAAEEDGGRDVVVIGHSYGGTPASQCVEGLGKEEREGRGERGGVVAVGYLTSLVPEVGGSAGGVLGEVKDEENQMRFEVGEDGWMQHTDLKHTARVCASSMTPEEREPLFELFPKHSALSFGNELTYGGYKDFPVSYLVCEDDLCIPATVQRDGIEMMERVSGRKVDVTSVKADHVPNVSAPQILADWFVAVAEKFAR